ncbi:MAG: UbiA family prenyltransferase [Anaerolineaceae bacterium]|nr:UbiA family prenyltransferase [Anaerolineaceae bacterium]
MREFLYRVLPENWVRYILHTRPRAWPIVTAHMTVGFILAKGLHLDPLTIKQWLLAALAWGILGNGGTLAINSVYDKDEGDIGYLDDPPPLPPHLASFSLILLALGFIPAALLGTSFLIAYALSCSMSLLYSVPPVRLKARAGWDVLINSTGFGALTIFAGWAAASQPIRPPIINIVLAFFFFFVGFYPTTQIYQMEEDQQRGDLTIALALGKKNALRVSILGIIIGFTFLGIEVTRHFLSIRAIGLLLGVIAWAVVLLPWLRNFNRVDTRYEKRRFYLALYAWAVTDLAVAIAFLPVSG